MSLEAYPTRPKRLSRAHSPWRESRLEIAMGLTAEFFDEFFSEEEKHRNTDY